MSRLSHTSQARWIVRGDIDGFFGLTVPSDSIRDEVRAMEDRRRPRWAEFACSVAEEKSVSLRRGTVREAREQVAVAG